MFSLSDILLGYNTTPWVVAPRALASGLSYVQVDKHGITI